MVDLKNIKIAVLGGGVSSERDISLISAEQVFEALKRQGADVIFIDINTKDEAKLKPLFSCGINAAFIALHGEFGEDGGIQKILEEVGVAYTGSGPLASYRAMDKIISKEIFFKQNIPTPRFSEVTESLRDFSAIRFPAVVKPRLGGSSIGISIVDSPAKLPQALEAAFALDEKVIVEDYIKGRELTVGILGEKPLAVIEIIPKRQYFDFTTKYSDGLVDFVVPAAIPEALYGEVQRLALSAHQALGCRHFSRVDFMLAGGSAYVLEVNSIPGLTTHSLLPLAAKHSGLSFDELILTMLRLSLDEKRQ